MYISERLNEHHVVDSFDSGREQLDQWLKDDARRAQASGMAQVYVWREPDSQVVVGYFAITPANVAPDDLSRSVRAGYSNRIPGYLIARLAIVRDLQGSGYGSDLLLDALESAAAAANLGGGRLVVVDAIDDNAFAFYRHHGLMPIGGTSRLFVRIDRINETLGAVMYGQGPTQTVAVAAGFQWAITPPPDHKLVLQLEPVARAPRAESTAKDAAAGMFSAIGFKPVVLASGALDEAARGVTCRIDSPIHLTIVIRHATGDAMDIPVPHDRPDLTTALEADGFARTYATTDSIASNGLLDSEMMMKDMANGAVAGALVAVTAAPRE
jgi:GNAT superfamily N-acetyltransferase